MWKVITKHKGNRVYPTLFYLFTPKTTIKTLSYFKTFLQIPKPRNMAIFQYKKQAKGNQVM